MSVDLSFYLFSFSSKHPTIISNDNEADRPRCMREREPGNPTRARNTHLSKNDAEFPLTSKSKGAGFVGLIVGLLGADQQAISELRGGLHIYAGRMSLFKWKDSGSKQSKKEAAPVQSGLVDVSVDR